MLSILYGVGKLLLGPRDIGIGLIVVGVVCLVWSIRRIQKDCANDVDEPDFLSNK